MSESFSSALLADLQSYALSLPGTAETGACVNRKFTVGKKSFLFLGEKPDEERVMVKLTTGLEEASRLAQARPEVRVGKGWVTVKLAPGTDLPEGTLLRWAEESYRAQATKTLLRALDGA